jgi:6-phosphogluconolactonase/glucosamine-6-phosphate isomerase/deaminase
VPTPPYQFNKLLANAGEIVSKGIELAVTGIPVQTKDWEWSSTFTIAFNDNKIVKLSDPEKGFNYSEMLTGGVGENGHLAFNEPYTSLQSRTHVQTLTHDTLVVNSRFFDNDFKKVPKQALSVGIATVLDAKEVLILALGPKKARAVQHCVEGNVNHVWPISSLQTHPCGILVCDDAAATEVKVSTYRYFKEIEKDSLI